MQHPQSNIWKVRIVKDYAGAHNHVLVGQTLDHNDSYLRMYCRSYHFGKGIHSLKDIRQGALMVRIIPWHRIEIINELTRTFNYTDAKVHIAKDGGAVLYDGTYTSVLATPYNKND